ncbi:hypothetical protein OUZ56_011200 [Daphnia magna]|uniref:Uncharacterized protein n=1 Tax=Daphnia magna TaxID=35525 RepID=A0ABQ9YZQ0_9CRUS|nr:hypothetical protein OUZ56_011200 [Daphnia magna]
MLTQGAQHSFFDTTVAWLDLLAVLLNRDSDTTYNSVCSTLLNNCEEGTLTEIGHQEDAEHSTLAALHIL